MPIDFSPAALRALQWASVWAASASQDHVDAPVLLLGLLGESECRAAGMLAGHAIDLPAMMDRWPKFMVIADSVDLMHPPLPPSPELALELIAVEKRLDELPRPLMLSTEHLLLALVDSSSEAGQWLRQRGFSAEELAAEIYRLHGVVPGPLDVELDELLPKSPNAVQESVSTGPSSDTSGSPLVKVIADPMTVPRILDAAANRAHEALRVIEDYLRFGMGDAHLTLLAKTIRHDLAAALSALSMQQRLAARQTEADIGTQLATSSEFQRADVNQVIQANFSRLTESLRSLEEFTKIDTPVVSRTIEQLRYRVYTLHRAVGITAQSNRRLHDARLYVLLDGRASLGEFRELAVSLVDAGADVLQLRDKAASDRTLLNRARALREITMNTPTLFIMNDRPDLAVLSGADGVHVGQAELSVREVRKIIGLEKLVGVSTHNIAQARQAVIDGANYIGVGPTFPSQTKQFESFPGLDFVRQVAAEISLPAFAIGGMDAGNVAQVIDAGICRVAVSAAVVNVPAPIAVCEKMLDRLRAGDE